jgi:HD domain
MASPINKDDLYQSLLTLIPPAISTLIAESQVCKTTWQKCLSSYPPALFHHTIRVFIYAQALAFKEKSPYIEQPDLDLLFAACLYHDISACKNHSHERFEVNGGDIAVADLESVGVPHASAWDVWIAIALHTSSGIAERISPLARIVRLAVLYDFGRKEVEALMPEGMRESVESVLPRDDVEKVLGDGVTIQGVEDERKAPKNSWPGCLLAEFRRDPTYEGVNPAF